MSFGIRPARIDDVDAMRELIDQYAAQDLMLSRTSEFLLTRDLAEIRSLAVRPETSGRGVGKALVDACVEHARWLGLRRVFALTLVPEFFERCGFTLISLGRLPEKSAAECPVCPKRFACDEQAMLMHLDGTRPEPLRPGEPWGYTRIFLGQEPSR